MMNFVSKKLNNKRGFTLIELIVVIAIIGILVLLATPKFLGYTKDAQVASMQADAKVLSNAALQYNIKNDDAWPIGETPEEATLAIPTDAEKHFVKIFQDAGYVDGTVTDVDGLKAEVTFYKIDADKVAPFVKNTAEDLENYVLVIKGPLEGEVFHIEGKVDSEGTYHNGIFSPVLDETSES